MLQKLLILVFTFILLTSFNLFIGINMINRNNRLASTERILNEITSPLPDSPQNTYTFTSAPFVMGAYTTKAEIADARGVNLRTFFRKYNSPLYDYADFIVETSDKYKFDYRLLPAIAMQESNLCRVIPDNSHNCWGWGIYGETVTRFDSYEEAIEAVAKGLKKNYIDKGLVTASAIMSKYNPSSNGSWAHGVNVFLKALE
ncbi:hypothetical protein HGB07_06700 [Candidatus Roizmanbacteria bacterium]|nr:hypothetical protein [Candidatus Roizmanbacteria bacterium]